MNDCKFRDARIIFSKTGVVKYISHLDTVRCFSTALRRSGLPMWYTEGYNPRPYLDFPRPLPLGVEGKHEILEMRFVENIANDDVVRIFNEFLPKGFSIIDCVDPYLKRNEIDNADYTLKFDREDLNENDLERALFCGELKCEKKGKQGGRKVIKTVDISSSIERKKCKIDSTDDETILRINLPCSDETNVNILNVVTAVNNFLGSSAVPTFAVREGLFSAKNELFK